MNSLAVNSMRSAIRAVLFGLSGALCGASLLEAAPQIVTVCGTDNAAGGLNLASAVAAGGEIVIRCPAGQQTIRLTGTINVKGIVHLDGEGKVTLQGPVAGPLFAVDIALGLSRLTVENLRTAATRNAPGSGSIVVGVKASIELDNVTTQNSLAPYTCNSFIARKSRFLNNGDPAEQGAYAAVVNAATIDLRYTTFTGNLDHPVASGPMPDGTWPALSRNVVIEDSSFTNNRSALLLTDSRVSISRTKFVSNGTQPGDWGQAWGCCGGALTLVRSDASVTDAEFRGNGANGFGGAIYALGTHLKIADSVLQGNQARSAGAIFFWGRWPKVNVWGVGDPSAAPQLEMRRTEFRENKSTTFGGALVFAGTVKGNSVLLQANESNSVGGAIADWSAAGLPDPYGAVIQALVDNTQPGRPDVLALARPILVDNIAGTRGAALAVGSASVALGNGLVARNKLQGLSGGALSAAKPITLVNTTIADNPAGGLVTLSGAVARLGNSILLRNAHYNCLLSGSVTNFGSNFQYPGNTCSAMIAVRDAGLDGRYAPGLISAAREAGVLGLCASDPQVGGVDLFGKSRLEGGHCDAGAIERPFPQTIVSALGFGATPKAGTKLIWFLLWLVLLLFCLGFVLALLWRRRKRRRSSGVRKL